MSRYVRFVGWLDYWVHYLTPAWAVRLTRPICNHYEWLLNRSLGT